jgi:hypothetical protein
MNKTEEQIRQELSKLLTEESGLLQIENNSEKILTFGKQYQTWYTRALKIVEALAPDRLSEFVGYYRVDPNVKGCMRPVIPFRILSWASVR